MDAPLQFVAEVAPVREVSLIAAADLSFWRDQLLPENLFPAELDGQARLLICGTDARFHGIRFQELSISVMVNRQSGRSEADGAYLVQAFNSNWFFALVERRWFATPYEHARIEVDPVVPASIRVRQRNENVFVATMAEPKGAERRAIRCGDEGWEGPIFLPGRRKSPGDKWFYGRIRGLTHVYPFLPDCDELSIRPHRALPALSRLCNSNLTGRLWILRDSAIHAKSKTYARAALEALRVVQPAVAAAEA